RIAPQPAMELIAQAALALQAVHDQGIVHRDVKPGNLLVQRDGTLVITDFGIARSDVGNRLTDAGMVLGTAAYCAPEQAEGAPVTPAVDIYALGVVAYECLAGQRPFDGDSPVTIALKHIREAPPPLPPDVPQPVRALVETALSKDPARRFPNARAMSEAARRIATGEVPSAPPAMAPAMPTTGATMAPPPEAYQTGALQAAEATTVSRPRQGRRAAKAPRRGGLVAAMAAAVVVGVGAGAVALTNMSGESVQPTDPIAAETTTGQVAVTEEPSPTKTRTRRPPTRTPSARPTTQRAITPTADPTPTEPTESPSPSVTQSPTPTKTPTPTPTPQPKKPVPYVVDLPYPQAKSMITAAGFKV